MLDIQNRTGDFEAAVAVQYATIRPERPSDPAVLGSAQTSTSLVSATLATSSRMEARIGLAWRLTPSTQGTGTATVRLWRSVQSDVIRLGTIQHPFGPIPAGVTQRLPLTSLLPTVTLAGVKAALLISGVSGAGAYTLTYGLAGRLFATDPKSPGAWTALETATTTTGTIARNTGVLALPSGSSSAMWFEPAIDLSASDAALTCTVEVILLGKRA